MNTPLQELLAKEVSRKEFLAMVGLGILSLTGLASFLRFFTGRPMRQTSGYGSSPYGK